MRSRSFSKLSANTDPPHDVFIVYQETEQRLAEILDEFLTTQGLNVFYCRKGIRIQSRTQSYRLDLANHLSAAKCVLFLVSRSFRWSDYCQAEVGGTITCGKPYTILIVPPLGLFNYHEASPLLEGKDVFLASDPEVLETVLKSIENQIQKSTAAPRVAKKLADSFSQGVHAIEQEYMLSPGRRIVHVWPSINDKCSEAQASIKNSIVSSLKNAKADSKITFVGVALKYSLKLFNDALIELCNADFKHESPKTLSLRLVHMDDYSQALHAIGGGPDVEYIRRNFNKGWTDKLDTWIQTCASIGVSLNCEECRTDFVPVRVGILIDDEVLFEGSCSYERASNDEEVGPRLFRLMVGELEYTMYRTNSNKFDGKVAHQKIEEFRSMFDFYKLGSQNSIMFVPNGMDWSTLLSDGLVWHASIKSVTFVSNRGEKFKDLCLFAAGMGKEVLYYVHEPKNESESSALLATFSAPNIQLKFFRGAPTFRAVLFDDVLIGIQMYNSSHFKTSPTCLRLIATKCSDRFLPLRDLMIKFIENAGVT